MKKLKIPFIIIGIAVIIAVIAGIVYDSFNNSGYNNDDENETTIADETDEIDEIDDSIETTDETELVNEEDLIGYWYTDDKAIVLSLWPNRRAQITVSADERAYMCDWEPSYNSIILDMYYPIDEKADSYNLIELENYYYADKNEMDVFYNNTNYRLKKYIPKKIEYDENGNIKPEDFLGQWGQANDLNSYVATIYFREDNTASFYNLDEDNPDGEQIRRYDATWEIQGPKIIVSFEQGDWEFCFRDDEIGYLVANIDSDAPLQYVRSDKGIIPDK